MNTKYQLKLEMHKLKRQQDDVVLCEKSYYSATQLSNTASRVKHGKEIYKKFYTRMEDARTRWWRSIDKKMDIESNIKILEKKLVEEIMEEIK